ncbi:MAG: DUF2339 domain-containing protein [Bacteroidota bacterium]|nr:DUF2339 domain-containing protein [Bacteroidota bacterium]
MESLLEYIFYGVYIIAFAFLLLVLYLNNTNRRLKYLLKKINELSGSNKEADFPDSKIKEKSLKILRGIVKIRQALSDIHIRKFIYEYFLSANIITLVGSILLAVGIGFFVRYPEFNQQIGIIGRMSIALLGSFFLLFISNWLRKKHPAYSSLVMGASFGILYFSVITGFYNYSLYSIGTAFSIILLLTGFSVTLAVFLKRPSLVVLSVWSAALAPFLVDYDFSDPGLLFNYIIILDLGVLILTAVNRRLFLNLSTFIFSGVYFLIWLIKSFQSDNFSFFEAGFLYLIIFYLLLLTIHSIGNILNKNIFKPFELSSIITLNMLVFAGGYGMLTVLKPEWLGLFTALMAVFNLIYLTLLQKLAQFNKRLIYLVVGLVLVFVTLIPPVEFVGRSIVMVWSLQLVMLLWIAQKIDVLIMKLGSFLLSIAVLVNTAQLLQTVFRSISPLAENKTLFFNLDFISGTMASFSFLVAVLLLSREKGTYFFSIFKVKTFKIVLIASAVILFYLNLYVEIKYHITNRVYSEYARIIFMGIYNFAFVLLAAIPTLFVKKLKVKLLAPIIAGASLLAYFVFYYMVTLKARSEYISSGGITTEQFYSIFFIDLIVAALFLVSYFNLNKVFRTKKVLREITLWPFVIFLVIAMSFAMDHINVIINSRNGVWAADLLEEVHRMQYTVLWSVSAMAMIVIGTVFNVRQLRQLATFSVFVILFKLLVIDLGNMEFYERTVSFITVGSVLLIIALIYQLNKKKFDLKESDSALFKELQN